MNLWRLRLPLTVRSLEFQGEFDLQQLLAKRRGLQHLPNERLIASDDERAWIKKTAICPVCDAQGAIVKQGHGKAKQEHFSFADINDGDPHHPFCDFHAEAQNLSKESSVDFFKARDGDTKWVRALVSRAIDRGLVSQQDFSDLRLWSFKLKCEHQVEVNTDPEALQWAIMFIRRAQSKNRDILEKHDFIRAAMPRYNWREVSESLYFERHRYQYDLARTVDPIPNRWDFSNYILELAERFQGNAVFDRRALKPYHTKVRGLANFALRYGRGSNGNFNRGERALHAFCAALLCRANWSVEDAELAVVKIFRGPESANQLQGNIVGFDPFHEFSSWAALLNSILLFEQYTGEVDLNREIEEIEAQLRLETEQWMATEGQRRGLG